MEDPMHYARPKFLDYVFIFLDQWFCFLFVSPCIVLFWRGTWELMDYYILPEDGDKSAWICIAVGNIGMVTLSLSQEYLKRHLATNRRCSAAWLIGYHAHTYLCGNFSVFLWRGMWLLLDEYTGKSVLSGALTTSIGWVLMVALRASKNSKTPPMAIAIDTDLDQVFTFTTRFSTVMSDNVTKYIFDTLLTICIIHNLVVFFWRGTWELLDLLVYPDEPLNSALAMLWISTVIMLFYTFLELAMFRFGKKCARVKVTWSHVIIEALIQLVANFGCVCQWRALWNLYDIYLLPNNMPVSVTISHVCGYLTTTLLLASASNAAKGCNLDGDMFLADQVFPTKYIRHFMAKNKRVVVSTETDSDTVTSKGSDQSGCLDDGSIQKVSSTYETTVTVAE